ncbi:hypothetical protein A2773_02100 [Candidatus Gottesmanbacteria bacterium RIFCSPHIGHO2_01_FULL_39_10]|uniref:Fibronectin type-III domain-containing protein n=1 Tax=Candidatus Gottesmanbacteria bacterium RIFCSPHIGHO2_01_FULL_39_10 TaxID=1798375 RepID=A0A1F5ZSE1_9BACT|nr:MAG: hypothetical protein A2773_02100 [Candidatus Gottesmanbacteria bacterium RIFCSPHIGHO2_01_FULL_39_10]
MYRREKRIPTFVALIVILFGLGGGILLLETQRPISTSADTTLIPSNMHLTNISDSQFSVSWMTSTDTTGYIEYSSDKSKWEVAFDDRDVDGKAKNYSVHHVNVKNLKENTPYYFRIISGGTRYDNEGKFFQQDTGPKLATSLSLNPAYGVIYDENDKEVAGAIIYLTLGKGLPLSTLIKDKGTWLIPLNNVRTQDLLSRPTLQEPEVIQISVLHKDGKTSYATTDTNNASPVPSMNLGKSYDFRNLKSRSKQDSVAQKKTDQAVLGEESVQKVSILFPDRDGTTTIDSQPLIRGTGITGQDVVITVNSTPQIGKVTVDKNGAWSFRPKSALGAGSHTVSITTVDSAGKSVTLSRKFIVLKSGERVLGEATPSGSLSPTLFPSTTPFETIAPTEILTPTPPVTGFMTPTYIFLTVGALLVIAGLKFIFLP